MVLFYRTSQLAYETIYGLPASKCRIKEYTINLGVPDSCCFFGLKKIGPETKQLFGAIKDASRTLSLDYEMEVRVHELLDPLDCPYIIKLYESIRLNDYKGLLITPLYKPFSFEELRPYAKLVVYQLLKALKVCHDNKISHRDIKPDNIVWTWDEDKPHIYLTDFGIAIHEDIRFDTAIGRGTFDYMPMSDLLLLKGDIDYRKWDIWGAGLVLAELLLNRPRILSNDPYLKRWNEMKDEWFRDVDPKAYDLVLRMLAEEPKDRILVDDALAHEYFDEVREVQQSDKKRKHNCIDELDNASLDTSECHKKIKTKAK